MPTKAALTKAFLGALVFCCTITIAKANDSCVYAIQVICGQSMLGSTVGSTFDAIGTCGIDNENSSPGVWYYFTGSGDSVTVTTCSDSSNYDTKLSVFSGSCSTLVCIDGNDDNACSFGGTLSTLSWLSYPGTSYYILVHGFGQGVGDFELKLSCQAISQCDTLSAAFNVTDVSTTGGSDGSIDLSLSGGVPPFSYLWSNGATTQDLIGIAAGNYAVTISSDSCLLVDSTSVNEIPDNDFCSGASVLTVYPPDSCVGNETVGTTVGATSPSTNPSCDPVGQMQDVWYTFDSQNNTEIQLSLNLGTANYVGYEISDACGSSVTSLSPNCDFSSGTLQQKITGFTGFNTTYYLRVWSNLSIGDTPGNFVICMSQVAPANDQCISAQSLAIYPHDNCPANATTGNTAAASYSGTNPYCDPANTVNDVWYSFNPGISTELSLSIDLGSSSVASFEILNECGVVDTNVLPNCDVMSSSFQGILTGFRVSTDYYVRVWSNPGLGDISGTFSICLSEASLLACDTFQLDFDVSNTSIPGAGDGAIDLTVNGTPPHSYSWSNGETTEDIAGLVAGVYNVTVISSDSCVAIDSAFVIDTPINSSCQFAETLTIQPLNGCSGNQTFGTTAGATIAGEDPSCDMGGLPQDVWFNFNSGANTELQVSITKGTNTISSFEIFNACGSPDTSLSPNCMWTTSTTLQPVITGFPGVPTPYYLRVWCSPGYGDTPGTFEICLSSTVSCVTQNITINPGWNSISSYIVSDEPNMDSIIKDISSEIILIKDGRGQAVFPLFGINQIGDWNILEGYQLKALSETTLTLGCTQADPTTPIPLSNGWSVISYLQDQPIDASIALAPLGSNLILAKNASGQAYFPLFGINNIGNMQPGQGYNVKLLAADTLIYPGN